VSWIGYPEVRAHDAVGARGQHDRSEPSLPQDQQVPERSVDATGWDLADRSPSTDEEVFFVQLSIDVFETPTALVALEVHPTAAGRSDKAQDRRTGDRDAPKGMSSASIVALARRSLRDEAQSGSGSRASPRMMPA
jgi:hypothetical protein